MIDMQEFASKRPFLYHLTDRRNIDSILKYGSLLSTKSIAALSLQADALHSFLTKKRSGHEAIVADGIEYWIRDEKPILLGVLERSLEGNISTGRFIELLNSRSFWWPTLERLRRHFKRYEIEKPVIIRVQTSDMIEQNPRVEFSHLNSGATRCHPKHKGNAPARGIATFKDPHEYEGKINSIAEVTFLDKCDLPLHTHISDSPDGPWLLAGR